MNKPVSNETGKRIRVDQPGVYRIKIQGRLSESIERGFEGMAISVDTNAAGIPITTLEGPITDQSALHGIVARVRDLGLPLVLVELVNPLEDGV